MIRLLQKRLSTALAPLSMGNEASVGLETGHFKPWYLASYDTDNGYHQRT